MWASAIVEAEVTSDRAARLADGIVGSQIDLLVLDRPPQPLAEDVVAPGALAVHADRNGVVEQYASEVGRRELTPLIGVEDLRPAMLGQCFFERVDAEVGFHRDRHTVAQ